MSSLVLALIELIWILGLCVAAFELAADGSNIVQVSSNLHLPLPWIPNVKLPFTGRLNAEAPSAIWW